MFSIILMLLWVFLTLFSVIGAVGIVEVYPSLYDNDIIGPIILIVNFYLSNIIAYIIGSKSTLCYLNLGLILAGTGIVLFGFEVFATWYVFDEFLIAEWGFWSSSIFIMTLIIVLFYGGLRQIILLLINTIFNYVDDM